MGCDGARSLVRKHAGIGFPGFTGDEISRIARVTIPAGRITRKRDAFDIPGVGRVAAMRPNQLPGGSFSIAPMSVLDRTAPDDLYLVSTHEPRGGAEPSDSVSIDELRASLHRVLGVELPISDATDIRSTVGNSRQADAYRRGRIFLAGDAAHVFNAGGSALNVGIQDALDLAARLTAALRGESAVDELDAYESDPPPRRTARAAAHSSAGRARPQRRQRPRPARDRRGTRHGRRAARSLARLIEEG